MDKIYVLDGFTCGLLATLIIMTLRFVDIKGHEEVRHTGMMKEWKEWFVLDTATPFIDETAFTC